MSHNKYVDLQQPEDWLYKPNIRYTVSLVIPPPKTHSRNRAAKQFLHLCTDQTYKETKAAYKVTDMTLQFALEVEILLRQ